MFKYCRFPCVDHNRLKAASQHLSLQSTFLMENEGTIGLTKRMKHSEVDKETIVEDGSGAQLPGEEAEPVASNSEHIQMEIAGILGKIENFTQMVSELLDSGKSMLKELSNGFEEHLILNKWRNGRRRSRNYLLDAANEDADALLHNAKYILQNVHGGPDANE